MEFTIKRVLDTTYDDVLAKLPEKLKGEGFGVLTEIDVKDTLKKKIGVDFRRYKILGACNPNLAHQALSKEIDIGAMLPCSIVVYERDDGKTVVAAIDPMRTIAASRPELAPIATQVRERLERVVKGL